MPARVGDGSDNLRSFTRLPSAARSRLACSIRHGACSACACLSLTRPSWSIAYTPLHWPHYRTPELKLPVTSSTAMPDVHPSSPVQTLTRHAARSKGLAHAAAEKHTLPQAAVGTLTSVRLQQHTAFPAVHTFLARRFNLGRRTGGLGRVLTWTLPQRFQASAGRYHAVKTTLYRWFTNYAACRSLLAKRWRFVTGLPSLAPSICALSITCLLPALLAFSMALRRRRPRAACSLSELFEEYQ